MKNKKKIIFVLLIIIVLMFICLFILRTNKQDKNVNDNYFNYELINLYWNEIVNIEIDGAEGNSNVVLTYNEIPELDNRVNETINNWESKRTEIDLNTNEAQEEYELVGKLTSYKEIQWCSLPDNWNTLSNGDELIIACGNEILKELGYEFDDTLTIAVNNLIKTVTAEPIKDNASSDIRNSDNYIDSEQEPIQSVLNENSTINKEVINNDTYYSLGNDLIVYPNDLNDFELENEEGKRIFIHVDTQTDFQKAKAYALENNNIDYIQIGDQVYDKDSNFEEWEEWKGATDGE